MPDAPLPRRPFWSERRSLWATFLVPLVILLLLLAYFAPWRAAYISAVDTCGMSSNQLCMNVWVRFNGAVANGTMHLLVVALQNGAEYYRQDYVDYHSYGPPQELGWGVVIPVDGAAITSASFRFTLSVSGAQLDQRTVGWQGG